jgi:hypothetical protein
VRRAALDAEYRRRKLEIRETPASDTATRQAPPPPPRPRA